MYVDIVDDRTMEPLDHCCGPTASGDCPRLDGQGVACAGRRVRSADAGGEYWLLQVPASSRQCPFAWDLSGYGAL